ncbi:putative retrotransposon hot spot protein (RHS) [Trypanosoma cruzi]|uniref:Putative retrotransposon hot spot protein (RHS) n=1 Tax=Trypanosoma cruzi TaxID=5693 RepID=A0A2V2X112_TRYCR|nr:putative retrotransposon hot spot protein (RHS) [Trypanosoma cruzi]RNC38490.1 retrotransposon hot spot (RHS) protein [Trypanosoma cruzi]
MKKGDDVAVFLPVARLVLLRGRWASAASPTGVAVRLHGAPTTLPCECHAQRHWDCGRKQPRVSFGASGTCMPQLGGASGMLHRTGVVMAPCSGSCDGSDAAARHVVESKVWPQWTMSSTNMRLSGFLWNYAGGRAAVGERLQCDDGVVCSGSG